MKLPLLLVICISLVFKGFGQIPGSVDTSFKCGASFDGTIKGMELLIDGKIICYGNFKTYDNFYSPGICRLNSDYSLDTNFIVGSGANATIVDLIIQPDGKYLIVGEFTTFNGYSANKITRLLPDGSVDISFIIGTGPNASIFSVELQPDGKFLIGGAFTSYSGLSRNRIARLNSDGSLDVTFNPGTGFNSYVWDVKYVDGKILVAGDFTSFNFNFSKNRIIRLNSSGSYDGTFLIGSGCNGSVKNILIQDDGKILISGDFTAVNGVAKGRISRLNSDGSQDLTFTAAGAGNFTIHDAKQQPDGKYIIAGNFGAYNGLDIDRLMRIETDGSIDTSFDFSTGSGLAGSGTGEIFSTLLLPDSTILIGGSMYNHSQITIKNFCALDFNGHIIFKGNETFGANSSLNTVDVNTENKLIITGLIYRYDQYQVSHIFQLNSNGTYDTTFKYNPTIITGFPNNAKYLKSGDILICGTLSSVLDGGKYGLIRIRNNGTYDPEFNPGGTGTNYGVNDIHFYPDEKYLITGGFSLYNGITRKHVAIINEDGTLYDYFDPGSASNGSVYAACSQADKKVLVGGIFSSFNGVLKNDLVRLNADGSVDSSFVIGSGFTGPGHMVDDIVVQKDQKILIAGEFNNYNGNSVSNLCRLEANGSLDTLFSNSININGEIFDIEICDENIFVAGDFTMVNGIPARGFIVLNLNGEIDPEYYIDNITIFGNQIEDITFASDNDLMIVGEFANYGAVTRDNLAKLYGKPIIQDTIYSEICEGDIYILPDGSEVALGGTYIDTVTCDNNCTQVIITILNTNPSYFFDTVVEVEPGFSFELPDLTIVTDTGLYTINFLTTTGCDSSFNIHLIYSIPTCDYPTEIFANAITSVKATIHWIPDDISEKYKIQYRAVGAPTWLVKNSLTTFKKLTGLTPGTTYEYKIKSICDISSSTFSPIHTFTTLPLRESIEEDYTHEIAIYPNPNNGKFYVELPFNNDFTSIEIYSSYGAILYSEFRIRENLQYIELPNYSGLIIIKIETNSVTYFEKVVIY